MRQSMAAMMLAFGLLAPRRASADVVFPTIPVTLDPSTVAWFNGCTNVLSGACVTAGLARRLPNQPNPTTWELFYNFQVKGLTAGDGTPFSVLDSWSWHSTDNTCVGASDNLFWDQSFCVVPQRFSETFTVQIAWNEKTPPFGELHTPVTLSPLATPEPESMALAATGLFVIGGMGLSRRRRSKRANEAPPIRSAPFRRR